METNDYNRENIYNPELFSTEPDPMADFKAETGNSNFRISKLTWLSLFIIALFYPGISLLTYEDPSTVFANMNEGMRMLLLVSTIVMQWFLFMFVFLAAWRERTNLAGIGVGKLKGIHVAWATTFLIGAWLILSGLAWILAQIGLPMAGEISLLIPQDTAGRIVWVFVSLTAGFCEETMFRGYLMSRLRLVFKLKSWVWPVIISAVVFGACHAYQGLSGFIVLTVYGAMFALLYIRTKSLWPCILAHCAQDLLALFIPQ